MAFYAEREIDQAERKRAAAMRRVDERGMEDEAAQALANVTESQVRTMLGHLTEEMQLYDSAALKEFLTAIFDRVDVDPE